MTMTKRLLLGAGFALAMLASTAAGAQTYPTKLITVIIPFAGGSASDVVARIMLDRMSKNMGQTIVIDGGQMLGAPATATLPA